MNSFFSNSKILFTYLGGLFDSSFGFSFSSVFILFSSASFEFILSNLLPDSSKFNESLSPLLFSLFSSSFSSKSLILLLLERFNLLSVLLLLLVLLMLFVLLLLLILLFLMLLLILSLINGIFNDLFFKLKSSLID